MNLARAVRPHGGRVASIEVDPVHATIVRNMVEYAGLTDTVDVWTGYCYDVIPHLLDKYGPRSIGMVFMDQKGTRFHTDLGLMEDLDLLADGAVVLADNVLKPGAPLYIWQLAKGPFTDLTVPLLQLEVVCTYVHTPVQISLENPKTEHAPNRSSS